jgi:hypothetical protein
MHNSGSSPVILLIVGIIAISAATFFICTGRVWVRFSGWVYRVDEPWAFWGNVLILYLAGVLFSLFFFFGGLPN